MPPIPEKSPVDPDQSKPKPLPCLPIFQINCWSRPVRFVIFIWGSFNLQGGIQMIGMRNRILMVALATAGMTVGYATPAAAQATRTWVSGVGDDVNPCSRTAP